MNDIMIVEAADGVQVNIKLPKVILFVVEFSFGFAEV